jgi:hypothetical protein
MNDNSDIARLEDRIESLNGSIARCHKISIAAKAAVLAGAILLAVELLVRFDPTPFFGAITAILGGVVMLGSNATTWEQFTAERDAAEVKRKQTIDGLELEVVTERPTLH